MGGCLSKNGFHRRGGESGADRGGGGGACDGGEAAAAGAHPASGGGGATSRHERVYGAKDGRGAARGEDDDHATVSGRAPTPDAGEAGSASMEEDEVRWSCGELIGAGAFGRVYMGMNLESGELMAVKQVSFEECETSRREDHVRALENEVAVLKRLRHVNIVRYLGTERTLDSLNIFLEYVPGGSIHSLLVKVGSFGGTRGRSSPGSASCTATRSCTGTSRARTSSWTTRAS